MLWKARKAYGILGQAILIFITGGNIMADEIKDIMNEEEMSNTIVLEDDLGNEVEFDFLDVIEYEGVEYIYLLPTDEDDSAEVVILKITSLDDENESFEGIEDDELIDTLFTLFKDKWKNEFDFE